MRRACGEGQERAAAPPLRTKLGVGRGPEGLGERATSMSGGSPSGMKDDSQDTPVSVPIDKGLGGSALSQRFHFRPYESVSVSDNEEPDFANEGSSQPFLQPGAPRSMTMRDRLGTLGMIPVLLLYVVHWVLLKWKAIAFVVTLGLSAALLIFNMSRPEWREMAYYRYVVY